MSVSSVNDVVDGLDGVSVGSNCDVEGSWGSGTVNEVDSLEIIIGGSGGLGESINNSLWSSEERGSSVGDNFNGLGVRVRSELESGGLELIISGRGKWLISNEWSAVGGVDGSVGEDSSSDIVGGTSVLKPDGEEWLVEKSLVNGVDEWWDDVVDGEGGECKSKDSVGGVVLEVSGDLAGDSEGGGWDGELRVSLGSESNGILSEDSGGVSRSVLDGPGLSVLHESAGGGRIELALGLAVGLASWSWDPEVGGSSI